MRSNEVKDLVAQAREQAREQARAKEQCIKGIKTVCAEVSESITDNGEYALTVQWTTSDGISFRTFDSGLYAGKSFDLLCKIWNCSEDELSDKTVEETREVYFYAMNYENRDGEKKEMQKFRRVNALDRAHELTENGKGVIA